jgi:hypothetical protein
MSNAIDLVMKVRSKDPKESVKVDKKGAKKKEENLRSERSDLENQEYYRQQETQFSQ